MADDAPLKSSLELAMERLQAQDQKAGIAKQAPLTDKQKAKITRLRSEAKAALAEIEILHRKNLSELSGDPAELQTLEENYQTDRGRIESRLESDIRRVRSEER